MFRTFARPLAGRRSSFSTFAFNRRNVRQIATRHYLSASALLAPTLYFQPVSCEAAIVPANTNNNAPPSTALWAGTSSLEKLQRTLRLFKRILKLIWSLFPVVFFYPLYALLREKHETSDAHLIALHHEKVVTGWLGWYLNLCLQCVEQSGAAVIKLTQWASSRPDLFGHEACSVLSRLQDDTTPHSLVYTEQIMEQTYGENWEEKIKLQELLGSGCIGQVYKGRAKRENGETFDVAVKILHPSICEDIEADLDIMRVAVRALKHIPTQFFQNLRWLNMEGVVEEFSGLLRLQIDLRNEAENLEKFNENFKGHKSVEFPKLVPEYEPAERVLIETFCAGVPVMQFCREHRKDKELLTQLCTTAIEAVCKMIFLDNFVHGDMHPGNIFVSPDGKKFILLDLGIVNQYNDSDHKVIVDVLSAFIRKQGRLAGRLMIDDSNDRLKGQTLALEEEKYIEKIGELTTEAQASGYFMESLGSYISRICDAAATHQVLLNPSFVSAALAVKVEEGIALALDPTVGIPKIAIPIIAESEGKRLVRSVADSFKKKVAG